MKKIQKKTQTKKPFLKPKPKSAARPKSKPAATSTRAPKKPARPVKENSSIYLSNLSYNRDKQGIKNLASRYGIVKDINIVIDLDTKVSKGMAFVQFATVEEAKKAIAGLNQQQIDGRTLKATFAIPQNPLTLKLREDKELEQAEKEEKEKERARKNARSRPDKFEKPRPKKKTT